MFQYFYHQRVRRTVSIFGSLFNNIYVLRRKSDGSIQSQVKVPLAYAPKDKYTARLNSNPDLYTDTKVALKLPRMSFEITGFQYDAERQLPKVNNFKLTASDDTATKFFTPAPYLLSFQVNVYAKTQDDALQVVEQILPYFNPQYTLSFKPFADHPSIKEDISIAIRGVSHSDDYEAPLEQRRTIIYTLDFEMRTNFYGPLNDKDLIDTAITDVSIINDFTDSDGKVERITTTPTPTGVGPDSDYGFNNAIEKYYE